MGKFKEIAIEQMNKQQEIDDYKKFKDALNSCTKKLSGCNNEKH
jgi:hypothetical protein